MDLKQARAKGFNDGFHRRRESSLTVETMFDEWVGLSDEADELRHAYAFAYGRGAARRDHKEDLTGSHDFNDFMSSMAGIFDGSGLSETAHEGYHAERERIDEEEREREGHAKGGGGGSAPSGSSGGGGAGCGARIALLAILALLLGLSIFQFAVRQLRQQPQAQMPPTPVDTAMAEPPAESSPPPAPVKVEYLVLFEQVDSTYQASAPVKVLAVNHPYGSPVRDGFGAGFRFAGATPRQTKLRAEVWRPDGPGPVGSCLPDSRMWRQHAMGDWIVPTGEGNFICAYQGPMLGVGEYRVQIFVDGVSQASRSFQVLPREALQASAGPSSPAGTGDRIGVSSPLPERERIRLESEAWDRHNARIREIDAREREALAGIRDCFPDGEPCNSLRLERNSLSARSHDILTQELREIRAGETSR